MELPSEYDEQEFQEVLSVWMHRAPPTEEDEGRFLFLVETGWVERIPDFVLRELPEADAIIEGGVAMDPIGWAFVLAEIIHHVSLAFADAANLREQLGEDDYVSQVADIQLRVMNGLAIEMGRRFAYTGEEG